MIDPREIMGLVMPHVGRMLNVAEAALPPSQFKAFKKIALDEFGRNGLESELYSLIEQYPARRNG